RPPRSVPPFPSPTLFRPRHGAELMAGRLELCQVLAPYLEKAYDAISGSGGPASGASVVGGGPARSVGDRRSARITYRSGLAEDGAELTADREVLEARLLAALAKARD